MSREERDKGTNDTILKDYLEWIELNDIVCPYVDVWIAIFDEIKIHTKHSLNKLNNLIGRPCILNGAMAPNKFRKKRFVNYLKFAHEKKIMYYINLAVDRIQRKKLPDYRYLAFEKNKNNGKNGINGINKPILKYPYVQYYGDS